MDASSENAAKTWGIAVAGAAIGGVVGYLVFKTLLNFGLYGPMIPGSFVGIGAGLLLNRRNVGVGVFAAVVALALGVLADYQITIVDTFAEYITGQTPVTYLMLGLGTAMGFWFGVGRDKVVRVTT